MDFQLRPATLADVEFARTLTRSTMLGYYCQYDLLWSDEGFDQAWCGRENWLICNEDVCWGFVSLSRDAKALYIRELHLLEAFRGRGAGGWVIEQMACKAAALGRGRLRLTVFKGNPARELYERHGLRVVGQETCFLWMERHTLDGS